MKLQKLGMVCLPLVATLLATTPAAAEESGGYEEAADADGLRFRGGVSGGGGVMLLSGLTLGLGGVDGRLGVQINDLIGVYAQPQLGIYGGSVSGGGVTLPAVGGVVAGAALIDFTFIDQIFVAAGGGGGILNNPTAGELIIRAGGYPVQGFGEDNIRRKGLMLSVDLRLFFVSSAVAVAPTLNIGYEAF